MYDSPEGDEAMEEEEAADAAAATATALPASAPVQISGYKHKRHPRADAAATAKTDGRSDSGSNSPTDGAMTPDGDAATAMPPSKQQHR